MNYVFYLILLTLSLYSCKNEEGIDNLVIINEKGVQENKGDTLSVEDVLKLQNEAESPYLSYSTVITSSMEKTYPFSSDSAQTIKCIIASDDNRAKITLYKLTVKSVKIDSLTSSKITDYIALNEGDTVSDYSRKPTKYKAVVKIKNKLGGDSTIKYTLVIFKN